MSDLAQIRVAERTKAAEARRTAVQFANSLGFTQEQAGKVAIVATEVATNLATHAREGELLISSYANSLNLLSVDHGPGMRLQNCLEDGYSTAGTPGTGLGAIRRLSDRFEAYSLPSGTILSAGFGPGIPKAACARAPMKGETVCGDSWSVLERNGARWILVADGLGHGEFAAEASRLAVEIFETSRLASPHELVAEIHAGLRATRGAAVAVGEIRGSKVNFCGLGNIGAVIHSPGAAIHMVSANGTAGLQQGRTCKQFTYNWLPGSLLIMHSDGLQSHWGLERYPGILRQDPAIVAGILYRDFKRGRDDVTVVVVGQ